MKPTRPVTTPSVRVLALLGCALAATVAQAETRLERGRYLVESIAACGNCHTPQGPNGPVPGKTFAGGLPFEDKAFTTYASNITPDRETGIGKWTDAQAVRAIREGRRPDGRLLGPPMPYGLYRDLSDADVTAIVAYLRTVPAVKNEVPAPTFKEPLPPSWGPPVRKVATVSSKHQVTYGRYLAGPVGHCMECHSSPTPHGGGDLKSGLGAGGMKFPGPWGVSVATNLTPNGPLKHYSDDDIRKVITTGVRPDGSRLKPPMGTDYYAKMTRADLDAVVAYLRTLPPK